MAKKESTGTGTGNGTDGATKPRKKKGEGNVTKDGLRKVVCLVSEDAWKHILSTADGRNPQLWASRILTRAIAAIPNPDAIPAPEPQQATLPIQ
jgi:hypothetical protein